MIINVESFLTFLGDFNKQFLKLTFMKKICNLSDAPQKYNPGQNLWNKRDKSSQIGQDIYF